MKLEELKEAWRKIYGDDMEFPIAFFHAIAINGAQPEAVNSKPE